MRVAAMECTEDAAATVTDIADDIIADLSHSLARESISTIKKLEVKKAAHAA